MPQAPSYVLHYVHSISRFTSEAEMRANSNGQCVLEELKAMFILDLLFAARSCQNSSSCFTSPFALPALEQTDIELSPQHRRRARGYFRHLFAQRGATLALSRNERMNRLICFSSKEAAHTGTKLTDVKSKHLHVCLRQ